MFKANNNATVLKIDIPKNVQNLNIFETNNGELAFEYDHPNVFANLLVKFKKYCCFKFFYKYVKKKNSRKWRPPKFTVKVKCMKEGCPVVSKVQQLFSDENTPEEKLTIQLDGDIYHKLGDVKARKIIDNEKYNAYNLFQENTKLKPSTVYRKNLFNLNETSFGAGHRSRVLQIYDCVTEDIFQGQKINFIFGVYFPQKSLSYKNILSRMKKNNLTPPVLLGTYNIYFIYLHQF